MSKYTERVRICATRQFRHNTDNSPDIHKPKEGFVFAYDITKIDKIIEELESQLDIEVRERSITEEKLETAEAQLEQAKYASELYKSNADYLERREYEYECCVMTDFRNKAADRIAQLESQLSEIAEWKRNFRSLVGIRVAGKKSDKAVDEVIVTVCDELTAILEKQD